MRWTRKLGLALLVWLGIGVVGEGAARVFVRVRAPARPEAGVDNRAPMFVPHPYLVYAANPDHPEHSVDGFRTRTAIERDRAGWRIVCLGGSSTYDTRVDEPDSYPRQLERALAGLVDPDPEVLNGGLAGWSSPNLIGALSLRVVDYRPDVVVFYCGFNDAWNRMGFAPWTSDYRFAQRPWDARALERPWWRASVLLDEIARRAGAGDPTRPHINEIAWHRPTGDPVANWEAGDPQAFARNLRTLVAVSRAHGMRPVLCTQATDLEHHDQGELTPLWQRAMAETTATILEVAQGEDVLVIDVRTPMSDRAEWFADAIHMNADGNRERARLIAAALVEAKVFTGAPRERAPTHR